jgi:hypothetical protein
MKKLISASILSLMLAIGALAGSQTTSGSPHLHNTQSPQKVTRSDGSMVETTVAEDGTKTEVRTFNSGDISRVTRTTRPDGTRTVMVEYRDQRTVELKEESDIEQAMDATADTIASAAKRAWTATKTVGKEIGDKTEDVADKTVDVTKKAARKTKEAGKEVADKSEDVADKTVDTSKKVAVKGVKVTKEAGKEVADKSEDVADKTVDVTKEGVEKTKEGGSWLKRGFRKVGGWFKSIF